MTSATLTKGLRFSEPAQRSSRPAAPSAHWPRPCVPGLLTGTARCRLSPARSTCWPGTSSPTPSRRWSASWTAAGNPAVNLAVIPNLGYTPALQTRLRGGDKIDLYYNFAYNSQKFVDEGWAARRSTACPASTTCSPTCSRAPVARHVNAPMATIISAPYFSAVHMLHYNERISRRCRPRRRAARRSSRDLRRVQDACEHQRRLALRRLLGEGVLRGIPAHLPPQRRQITAFDDGRASRSSPTTPRPWACSPGGRRCTRRASPPSRCSPTIRASSATRWRRATPPSTCCTTTSSPRSAPSKGPQSANVKMAPIGGDNVDACRSARCCRWAISDSDEEAKLATWELMKYYGWKDSDGQVLGVQPVGQGRRPRRPLCRLLHRSRRDRGSFPDYYDLPHALGHLRHQAPRSSPPAPCRGIRTSRPSVGDIVHALLLGQATPQQTVEGADGRGQSDAQGGRTPLGANRRYRATGAASTPWSLPAPLAPIRF
jgi:multiple sugar transport system substrate-binding protein